MDIKLRLDRRRQSTVGRVAANHQARRKEEDNLAVVFMGIVGMFLACHVLRIFLNLHEMAVIREAMACSAAGRRGWPVWSLITASFRQDTPHNSTFLIQKLCKLVAKSSRKL